MYHAVVTRHPFNMVELNYMYIFSSHSSERFMPLINYVHSRNCLTWENL
jgi:hypothetical protein